MLRFAFTCVLLLSGFGVCCFSTSPIVALCGLGVVCLACALFKHGLLHRKYPRWVIRIIINLLKV